MTDEVIESGVQDQTGTQDVGTQTTAPAQQATSNADMVSKSRVAEIVLEQRRLAADKAYERGVQETTQKSQQQASSMGGMAQRSDEDLRRMMQEEFQAQHGRLQDEFRKQEVQQQVDKLTNDYVGKLNASKDRYPDLMKRQDELADIVDLIPFINESDEAAGITQHLLDNGHNVASLMVLQHKSPNMLRRELQKLAASIKNNDDAVNRPRANEPLYQPTPSTYTMDSGSDSIEGLKKQSYLRG